VIFAELRGIFGTNKNGPHIVRAACLLLVRDPESNWMAGPRGKYRNYESVTENTAKYTAIVEFVINKIPTALSV
jgi:hypothetical protein